MLSIKVYKTQIEATLGIVYIPVDFPLVNVVGMALLVVADYDLLVVVCKIIFILNPSTFEV